MKRINAVIAICLMLSVVSGCNTWKDTLCSQGSHEDMIRNCIIDFLHTKLASQDSTFSILFLDEAPHSKYAKLVIGSIGDKIYAYPQDTVGLAHGARIPTRYLVVNNNKLFVWDDENVPITQELISLYERFNLLDREWVLDELDIPASELTPELEIPKLILPPFVINDALEGAWYYVNKTDFTKYVRFIQSYLPTFEE